MIKINYLEKNKTERENKLKEYYAELTRNRNNKKIDDLNDWCKTYFSGYATKEISFIDVVIAEPKELIKMKEYLDVNHKVSSKNTLMDKKLQNYILNTLFNTLDEDRCNRKAKTILLSELGINVCPYCNRNYIISDSKKGYNTCELDHYFPKSIYPILAVSFYNLIPSCSPCNRLKKETFFNFYPHYSKLNTDDLLKFDYEPLGVDYLNDLKKINIKVEVLEKSYKEQCEKLYLEDLYKHHRDIVQEILKKKEIYSDTYIDALINEFPQFFSDREEVKKLIFGTPLTEKEYGYRPLSKLTHDIVEE